jgi:hypothetical protein
MSGNGDRFIINEQNIVHENIDGETVILNLDTGNYYSVVDVGADIWEYIVKGAPAGEILSLILANYDCSRGDEESAVHSFLGELQQEGLIVALNDQVTAGSAVQEVKIELIPREIKASFKAPALNKYTDMQDLLLLDPIHEVDAAGWPSTKPEK